MNKKIEKKTYINKIIGFILNIFLILTSLLIILGIWYLVQINLLNNKYADIFGFTFFEVATGSMSPTIETGDVVIVQLSQEVKEEDIIVYKSENEFITHRLIEIKDNDELVTRGDANNTDDQPINKSQVLGKVIYIIPNIGTWRKIILSPQVLILIGSLIILLGIALRITTNTEEKDD